MSHQHMSSSGASSSPLMSASEMQMTFFNSVFTPYLSSSWKPSSQGGYAGTCLFLIFLGAFFRILMAGKHLIEQRWHDLESERRYIAVRGTPTEAERINADVDGKKAILISEQGVEEPVKVVKRTRRPVTPWRFSIDGPRAAYTLLMSTVGYLLMLAVMTMNLGYFLSVLGGIFLGELAFGRYTQLEEH